MFASSSSSIRGLTPLLPLGAAVHLFVLSSSVSVADPAMALKLNLKPEREQTNDSGHDSPKHIESEICDYLRRITRKPDEDNAGGWERKRDQEWL